MARAPNPLLGWFRLVHPFPSFVVAVTAVGFAGTAAPLSPLHAFRLFVMVLCSQLAVGAFNDYCDAQLDAVAMKAKPIPAGVVPRSAALAVAAACLTISFGLAAAFGPATLGLALPATGAGLIYDFPLKRTAFSWLPYVLGLPLLPLWAWSTVGTLPAAAGWAYPIGALLALALHIANALPDDLADRASGTQGLVQMLGRRASLALLFGSFAAAAVLAFAFPLSSTSVEPRSGALAVSGTTLGVLATLVSARAASSRLAFNALAIGSALLALGVASAVGA